MRKSLKIAGVLIGVLILIIAAVFGYAVLNLNSIIAAQRGRILASASAALGREVDVGAITASLGWGVAVDLKDVKLADDPVFSPKPFVRADNVYLKVALMPLLYRQLQVSELVLMRPEVRIIRDRAGALNVATIGKKSAPAERIYPPATPGVGGKTSGTTAASPIQAAPAPAASGLGALSVNAFTIQDGHVVYQDLAAGGAPLELNALDLKVRNFRLDRPFNVTLALAALGTTQNLSLNGSAGPLEHAGRLDVAATALDLNASVGPLTLATLKAIPQLVKALPAPLNLTGPVTIAAKIGGTVVATTFAVATDLTSNEIAWARSFDKPAGVVLKATADGARSNGEISVRAAAVTLADLDLKATNIVLKPGAASARIDTNRFDLAALAKLSPDAAKYNPRGAAELHSAVAIANGKPTLDGNVALSGVNVDVPGGKAPPVGNLSGTIKLAGQSANAGPLTFTVGTVGHGRLTAAAQSIQPLAATYQLNIDQVKIAEIAPSRASEGDEHLTALAADGSVNLAGGAPRAAIRATVASGMIQNAAFSNLALDAGYAESRATVNSLKLNAFAGAIQASGTATTGATPAFDLKLATQGVDLRQMLTAIKSKAAETIRGLLTANLAVRGRGKDFDAIKPTLGGNGGAQIDQGKLVGVNVVAQALGKVDNIPGIGALLPQSVIANHPELFKSPNTDLQHARLTFVINGPRLTTNDLLVAANDYTVQGAGWFDLDQNIDMTAKILMSPAFSREMVAAKRNVSYLTTNTGQVEIPLRISGRLPKPSVMPDVGILAQRAASHAVEKGIGGLLQKKGLGGLFGGSSGGSGGGSNPLRRLFP